MKLALRCTAVLLLLLASLVVQANSQDNPKPYVKIPENMTASGSQTAAPCPNNTCGNEVTVFTYIIQSNVPQTENDWDTGVAKCVNANLRPIAVILGGSIPGGCCSTRKFIALCVK
jgi:hypothetical protein